MSQFSGVVEDKVYTPAWHIGVLGSKPRSEGLDRDGAEWRAAARRRPLAAGAPLPDGTWRAGQEHRCRWAQHWWPVRWATVIQMLPGLRHPAGR